MRASEKSRWSRQSKNHAADATRKTNQWYPVSSFHHGWEESGWGESVIEPRSMAGDLRLGQEKMRRRYGWIGMSAVIEIFPRSSFAPSPTSRRYQSEGRPS